MKGYDGLVKTSRVALSFLLGCTAACATIDRDERSLVVSVDSSLGFPVVRSTGEAPEWDTELIATIGSASGGPDEFGSIRSVLLDLHGNLYVVDPSYVQVSVFDSLGAFVRRIGQRGTGPGEYTNPYSVAPLHDSIALLDVQNKRIQVFGPSGDLVRSSTVTISTGPQIVRFYRTSTTDFWLYGYIPSQAFRSVFIRYTSSGPVDTIYHREFPPPTYRGALCRVANGGIAFYSPPFSAEVLTVPLGDGNQALALTANYRIPILDRDGDTVRVIERPMAPAPISDAEWNTALAKAKAWIAGLQEADCLRDTFERPREKPILGWLAVDDVGHLWVETATAAGRRYDVFGEDGALMATVAGLPSSAGVDPSIVAGKIALVVADESGVQRVQVYRILR